MSLRLLYRRIPANRRICNYYRCMKPILRNIARSKSGQLYHYECLQSAIDEQWRCRSCWLTFDATEASFEEAQDFQNEAYRERLRPVCPHCGNHDLKPNTTPNLEYRHRMPDGAKVACEPGRVV